jgi:hypothetical protein
LTVPYLNITVVHSLDKNTGMLYNICNYVILGIRTVLILHDMLEMLSYFNS